MIVELIAGALVIRLGIFTGQFWRKEATRFLVKRRIKSKQFIFDFDRNRVEERFLMILKEAEPLGYRGFVVSYDAHVYGLERNDVHKIFYVLPNEFDKHIDDKKLVKRILAKEGFPVAQKFKHRNIIDDKKIVLKPRSSGRGKLVSHSHRPHRKLFHFGKLLTLSGIGVVEEHISGKVYRALIVNGKLKGLLHRYPPCVFGDGKKTIKELIHDANTELEDRKEEFRYLTPFRITPVVEDFLAEKELSILSVPEKGDCIFLSDVVTTNACSKTETISKLHEHNEQLFLRVSALFRVSVLEIDFIIPSIEHSYLDQHCAIIDVHSVPLFQLHHDPSFGEGRNIAKEIVDGM